MNEIKTQPKPSSLKTRVFVIEDHELMRRSIVEAIEREPDLAVCGQSDDLKEAFAAILVMEVDLVLTDIQLKSSSGLDLIKALREHRPTLPILATTMFDGFLNERLISAAGASAFVSKEDGPEKLIATVHEMLKNREKVHDADRNEVNP